MRYYLNRRINSLSIGIIYRLVRKWSAKIQARKTVNLKFQYEDQLGLPYRLDIIRAEVSLYTAREISAIASADLNIEIGHEYLP